MCLRSTLINAELETPVARHTRAYTLVEVLVLVVILGIAGALVIPSFGSTDALRIQGAVRTIVSDITIAQSDAVAMQASRGILFTPDETNSRYVLADVVAGDLDTEGPFAETRSLGGERYGFARIESTTLNDDMLIFDAMGGPIEAPGSDVPAAAGAIILAGAGQRFQINIDAYTGRVTVQSLVIVLPPAEPEPIPPEETEVGG
jgi:type II secretory pathway pseudopilin PulG